VQRGCSSHPPYARLTQTVKKGPISRVPGTPQVLRRTSPLRMQRRLAATDCSHLPELFPDAGLQTRPGQARSASSSERVTGPEDALAYGDARDAAGT
jgi:hypothetical protein